MISSDALVIADLRLPCSEHPGSPHCYRQTGVIYHVFANKSIHYFSEQETKQLISELYRIMKPNGVFAFVVNSTNDSNFGAGQGIELEENFYEVRGTTKRFFSKEALEKFFDSEHWEFVCMNEGAIEDERIKTVQLQNDGKANRKITWTCMVKRK